MYALALNNKVSSGFHATTLEEFAGTLQTVSTLSTEEEFYTRWRARAWAVQRFSEEEFEKGVESEWMADMAAPSK